ncbi:MAG: hypothetical protein KDA92_08185 [Planctomycetales bacterium]|nr:hypothetical protein [Planctomycetales bacterium]
MNLQADSLNRRQWSVAVSQHAAVLYVAAIAQRAFSDEPPADAQSKPQVLAELVRLKQDAPDHYLIGQNIGSSNHQIQRGYDAYFAKLSESIGKMPAVLAVDYGYDQIGPGIAATNDLLIEHARQGGLVTISFHPPNPWRGTTCNDVKAGSVDVLLQPGTAANRRWLGMLDRIAAGLKQLQEAGVCVLFRPLHEMNGDWFWWSRDERQQPLPRDTYIRLWHHLHDYLKKDCQLDNLLWVYSPSARYDANQLSLSAYYPGDDRVDVVGLDYYGDPMEDLLHDSLVELARYSKPLAICEFGFSNRDSHQHDNLRLVRALKQHDVSVQYVVYWHSWKTTRVAIIDHHNADSLMRHPNVVTRSEYRISNVEC